MQEAASFAPNFEMAETPSPTSHLMASAGARALVPLFMPVLADLGCALVRVRLTGIGESVTKSATKQTKSAAKQTKSTKSDHKVLQVMAENSEGTLTLSECEAISHALSALLDVEDPINGTYTLEVSSAGVERPLTREADFEKHSGARVKLKTLRPIISDNKARSRFQGIVQGVEDGEVLLEVAVEGFSEPQIVGFAFSQISEVQLHPSEADLRNILNANKQ